MVDPAPDSEFMYHRFNRLIQELLRGTIRRNCFRPWEIEVLLDIEACNLRGSNRRELLRRYQQAVRREFDNGATRPMKLSEYLTRLRSRGKNSTKPAGSGNKDSEHG